MSKMPVLYLVARTDMKSMTPGRVAAQVSHATSLLEHDISSTKITSKINLYDEWKRETSQGFGTALVLEAPKWDDFISLFDEIDALSAIGAAYISCGIVNDPTYAVRDGDIVHYLPVDTAAYLLCYKDDKYSKILGSLNLYSGK